jgi:predicted Fe-Mo cluster-binding NifX family protein
LVRGGIFLCSHGFKLDGQALTEGAGHLRAGGGQDTTGRGPGNFHALANFLVREIFQISQTQSFQFVCSQDHLFELAQGHPLGLEVNHPRAVADAARLGRSGHEIFLCFLNFFAYIMSICSKKETVKALFPTGAEHVPESPERNSDMIIAVTAKEPDLDSPVDPRFGRAACFILVDSENMAWKVLDNGAGLDSQQGAGVQAAQQISAARAAVLLTGHCGPKAHQLLSAAGVEVYNGAEGTVREAVEKFQSGRMLPSDGPDVDGHWQ